jgi:hypothetical protein
MDNSTNNARYKVTAYRGNNLSDWYLPSQDELVKIYDNKAQAGISTGIFWSSTETGLTTAWVINFSDGARGNNNKSAANPILAVRAG